MATVVLDDHLVRDWLAGADAELRRAIGRSRVATTNLWYARLCKSAHGHRGGALLGSWSDNERSAVVAGLLALPETVTVLPMTELAWRMGELINTYSGLSMLGAEAVAAAERLGARMVVSSRDDGPGIRSACEQLRIRQVVVAR